MKSKLKEYRERKQLSQAEVANYLNVSTSIIHKWEVGTSYPSLKFIPKLAELYKVSYYVLITNIL